MDYTKEFEQQGARARVPDSDSVETAVAPLGLRVLTWLGVAFLVVAVLIATLPLQRPHDVDAGFAAVSGLDPALAVSAVVLGCTGVIVIAVRVAAGVLLRAVAAR